MGCGSCKSSKAIMPTVKIENDSGKDISSLISSQLPGASFLSHQISSQKNLLLHVLPCTPPQDTIRSSQSEEVLTASKEFIQLLKNLSKPEHQIQKEFKIFVWSQNNNIVRQVFSQRSYNEKLSFNSVKIEANFTIYSSSLPIVIDAIVYLIEKAEDFKEVFKVNQKFKHIWVQAFYNLNGNKNLLDIASGLGLQMFNTRADLFNKIFLEDERLNSMLKEIFNKIDADANGEIDFLEVLNAFKGIKDDISVNELREGLKRIDLNKDGKISFEEFCFWWKKGRQGPLSFSEIAFKWAKLISINNSETRLLLRKMTMNRLAIDKKNKKKEIVFKVGEAFEANTKIEISIGKSGMREKILNDLNFKLSLFSQEIWLSVEFDWTGSLNKDLLKALKKQTEVLIESLSGNFIDGYKLKNAIDVNVQLIESKVFLTLIIDIEGLEVLNEFLERLDEILISPTNDYIHVDFESVIFFYQLFSKDNLLSNLGNQAILKVVLEHWNRFFSFIHNLFPKFLKNFYFGLYIISNSKSELKFKDSIDIYNSIFNPFSVDLSKILCPEFLHFLQFFAQFIKNSLVVHLRFSNLGMRLKIASKDLIEKLSVINKN